MKKLIYLLSVLSILGFSSACGSEKSTTPDVQYASSPAVVNDDTPALTLANVILSLKEKSKQCFGSAGCNITVEPRMSCGCEIPETDEFELSFKITGDESGPILGTLYTIGQKYDTSEIYLSTKSSGTKIRIELVSIEKL